MSSFGFSAPFNDIETALFERQDSYNKLFEEMANFKPLSLKEIEANDPSLRANILASYPNYSTEQLELHVAAVAESSFQFTVKFNERYRSEYVQAVIFSHAMCEALINAILALGLGVNHSEEVFEIVEKANVLNKWIIGPKCFDVNYKFPKDGELYRLLKSLCKIRNDLMHSKITLSRDGEKIIDGTKLDSLSFDDRGKVKKFLELPYNLLSFAGNNLSKLAALQLFIFQFGIRKSQRRQPNQGVTNAGTQ
jgi:hypothetical protein